LAQGGGRLAYTHNSLVSALSPLAPALKRKGGILSGNHPYDGEVAEKVGLVTQYPFVPWRIGSFLKVVGFGGWTLRFGRCHVCRGWLRRHLDNFHAAFISAQCS
jgi:hypothetical protein